MCFRCASCMNNNDELFTSLHFFQDPPDCPSYSAPASPTPVPTQPPPTQPSSTTTAAAATGRSGVSGAQRRAQALKLGALMAELEKTLQNLSLSEKELRALDHQILHLATILKVNKHL